MTPTELFTVARTRTEAALRLMCQIEHEPTADKITACQAALQDACAAMTELSNRARGVRPPQRTV